MASRTVRVARAEDSDSDTEMEFQPTTSTQLSMNAQKLKDFQAIAIADLGSGTREFITTSDKASSRQNRRKLQEIYSNLALNQEGSAQQAQFKKNRGAVKAWNNPSNIPDCSEERLATLDNGQSHRIGLKEKYGEITNYDDDIQYHGRGGYGSNGPSHSHVVGFMSRSSSHVGRPSTCVSRSSLTRPLSSVRGSPIRAGPARSGITSCRPLDPAAHGDISYGYGKERKMTTIRDSTVRGSGIIGRDSGNPSSPKPQRPAATRPRPASKVPVGASSGPQVPTTLASPADFMKFVIQSEAGSRAQMSTPKPATKLPENLSSSAKVKTIPSQLEDSKWGPPAPNAPQSSIPSGKDIRLVPTNELVFPPPCRGGTTLWADGVSSPQSSIGIASPSIASKLGRDLPLAENVVGLGINTNGEDITDLMETDEDDRKALTKLAMAPKPMIRERVFFEGYWYILDRLALGNAPPLPEASGIIKFNAPASPKVISKTTQVFHQSIPPISQSKFDFAPKPVVDNPFAGGFTALAKPFEILPKSKNLSSSICGPPKDEVVTKANTVPATAPALAKIDVVIRTNEIPATATAPAKTVVQNISIADAPPSTVPQTMEERMIAAMNGSNAMMTPFGDRSSTSVTTLACNHTTIAYKQNTNASNTGADLKASRFANQGKSFSPTKNAFGDILTIKDNNRASAIIGDSRNVKSTGLIFKDAQKTEPTKGIVRVPAGPDYARLCQGSGANRKRSNSSDSEL